MPLPPRRLLRLLWPYLFLWFGLMVALGTYAWYEIRSTRERELASGRVEA